MDIKKKHHFVSQFYLRNWLNNSKKLCIWDGQEKTFLCNTENIAFRKSFYKIVPLTIEQIDFFKKFAEHLKFNDLSYYRLFILPILELHKKIWTFKKILNELGVERNDSNKEIFEKIDDIEKQLNNNIMEDRFSVSENSFNKLFQKIIKNDDKLILNFNDYDLLIYFIAFQLAKTPQKIERITNDDGSQTRKDMMEKYEFNDEQYHVFTLYSLLCISEKIYNISMSRLDKINIYFNRSDIRFITSDDPCFNQKYDEEKFYIQIPISPKVMIELIENIDEKKEEMIEYYKFNQDNREYLIVNENLINFYEIDKEEVIILNKKILENKDQFVYATSKEDIEKFKF